MKRDWLIQFRKSKQMTQVNVADSAFIDRGYYAQIESGVRNPSFSVAINIAKALDFDPSLFFQDFLHHSSSQPSIREISQYFRTMDSGRVLYLYNNIEVYLQHAVTFLLTGVSKGNYAIFIDSHENLIQIQQRLETIITNEEEKNLINLINKETIKQPNLKDLVKYLQSFQIHFDENLSIRIWLHEKRDYGNDFISKLLNPIGDIRSNSEKILFLSVFNASTVSAGMHIDLMRKYPYLMTDLEIVYSPLYRSSDNSIIFPSFFHQENV